MRFARLIVLLCAMTTEAFAAGKPEFKVDFRREGLTVHGLRPGTKVAWMAMVREPRGYHTRVRILRGYGPATPNSTYSMALDNADSTRGIWLIADVDAGTGVQAASPVMITSDRAIDVRATNGASTVEIDSGAVEVLYVRPRGGAWTFNVADGGGLDGDRVPNGTIVMPLASLRPLKGNPHAPAAVAAGDLILIIDPRSVRTASVEVGQ